METMLVFGLDKGVDLAAGVSVVENDLLLLLVVALDHELVGDEFAESLNGVLFQIAIGRHVFVNPRMGVFVGADGGQALAREAIEEMDSMLEPLLPHGLGARQAEGVLAAVLRGKR